MQKQLLNKSLRVMLFTNALILVAGAMMGPIYAIFVEKIGGDLLDAGLSGGLFALVAGLTVLISGKYTDKLKENELIVVLGYLIMAFGFFLYLFCDSIMFLMMIQVVIGIGEAIYAPAFDSVYAKHTQKKYSGRQWGAWEAMFYFVTAFGSTVGGLIAFYLGFSILFVIMTALCLFSAAYIYFLPRKLL